MRPKGSAEVLESRRQKAIELLAKRISLREVARRIGCNASSVMRWRNRHVALGEAGLKVRKTPGRPPRLSPPQKQGLLRMLLRGPEAYGWNTQVWTTKRIAQLIRRQYGIRYHPDHIGRVLHQLGWTVQKPERRAVERNEAAIQRWTDTAWERVKKTSRGWAPT
jgi:transposase